jgi:prevent-host-death family protein
MRTELVTTLKRKATEIIADLESNQDPVLITQHGKPAAYLMAVDAFDTLKRRLGGFANGPGLPANEPGGFKEISRG